MDRAGTRAVTPVLGNILLVAVALVIGMVVVTASLALLTGYGTPTAEAAFEDEQTPAGLQMSPTVIGTDVDVLLNGNSVGTFEATSAGESLLVPTAPGDTITVVSRDEDRTVLVSKAIEDRSEIGDFIAYYPFETQDESSLFDQSGNENQGTIEDDPQWHDGSLQFDGVDDYVTVSDISVADVSQVSEFTIAVAYETDDSAKQELIEHKSGDDNWMLELKPCDHSQVGSVCSGGDRYTPVFSVDEAGGSQAHQIFAGGLDPGESHVVVGTFDGSEHALYLDGTFKTKSGEFQSEISMGEVTIGKDNEGNFDYFNGSISEIRLYYTAFDADQVTSITRAMS